MESIGARALAARKFAKMTQKQAEAASGVRQSNISKIERGETSRPQGLLALARAYRADPNWLDTGDGPAPWDPIPIPRNVVNQPPAPYRVTYTPPSGPSFEPGTPDTVPLIAWTRIADWTARSGDETRTAMDAERWLPCIAVHGLGTCALRVHGDSMTAANGYLKSYPAGSIIFVDTECTQPDNGERVIAQLEKSGEITFKVFKEEDARRWLLPLNPKHEPIREAFTVLGTVIGKWEDEG